MELDTVVGKGGVTAQNRFDQTGVHADRLRQIVDHLGLPDLGTPPDVNAGKVVFTLEEVETDLGFVVQVWAENIHDIGHFNSVQFDFDFPPGTNFTNAVAGKIVDGDGWLSFALGTDGHEKEGLFGAFASKEDGVDGMEDGVDDAELLCTATFTGPFAAAFLVDIKRVKMSYGATRFPIAKTERVTPGD